MADAAEAADLYGLALEEFTAQRDRLARRLREEDRATEAGEVARMRKPTTDAWALNQVARRRPELVEELSDAHEALRSARDAETLSEASAARRRLVDRLMEAATEILEEGGHSSSGPVRDRISTTLLAAASHPQTEEALRTGRLARPAELSGDWPTTTLPPLPKGEKNRDAPSAEDLEQLAARARELAEKAEVLQEVARQARQALDEARREAEEANRAARKADQEARAAQAAVEAARRRRRG